jgi:alkylhydroperoxidase family enzyme
LVVTADVARLVADVARLVALSPPDDARINALVRVTCAGALSLPPLPSEVPVSGPESEAESAVVDFAEQFAVDVTGISGSLRGRLLSGLGEKAFRTAVLMYVADFVPRVRAGLDALGLGSGFDAAGPGSGSDALGLGSGSDALGLGSGSDALGLGSGWDVLGLGSGLDGSVSWDHVSDPADVVFNEFLPAVARLGALDPLTAEVVRLRGAGQHRCRLCNSLREGAALDAGGSETLYGDIERYDTSLLLSDRHKAALRYADALIWSPAAISADVASEVGHHFSDEEAVELTLDVMRNASNKIAVSFAADTPRVENGTEVYRILPDGQLEYS